jgi:hypothetical protein
MHAIGEERGTPYAVMDFVAGPDLGTLLLREGAMAPPRAVRLAIGIARASPRSTPRASSTAT